MSGMATLIHPSAVMASYFAEASRSALLPNLINAGAWGGICDTENAQETTAAPCPIQ